MMTSDSVRACEYCDTLFAVEYDGAHSERFCSVMCRTAAWQGGNPHVIAVETEIGREFLEFPTRRVIGAE